MVNLNSTKIKVDALLAHNKVRIIINDEIILIVEIGDNFYLNTEIKQNIDYKTGK